jgi:DNA polymerase-3 subunit delta
VAYYSGEDAYGIDRAVERLALALGGGERLRPWQAGDDESTGEETGGAKRSARILDGIEERVLSAPLFGGGTLAVVRNPAALAREKAGRERLIRLIAAVPPGNGLAFVELIEGGRAGKTTEPLRKAVSEAGGEVREFPALQRDRMERWLDERAGELGVRLGPGAAKLLVERVGAAVRENDIDRRRQSQLANAELEKLALYRPDGTVGRDDVAELVPESVPASAWAFADAVGMRRGGEAARLAERLMTTGTVIQVIVSQLHRRLRELILVREHLDAGARAAALSRAMGLKPFRAEKLAEQAARWEIGELEAALRALLDVDLVSKGIALDGSSQAISEDRAALTLQAWIAESVVGDGAGPPGRRAR